MTNALRLNARLTPELGAKLTKVRRRTGRSTTEIVHEALDRYCDGEAGGGLAAALADSGLVGCADGSRELSSTYKDAITQGILQKGRGGKP